MYPAPFTQRPQCNYPTVLDLLDVKNPNVLNVLIDQLNVESILLIKDRVEASHVIVRQQPRGAKSAYTIEGDMVLQYAHYSNKQGKFGIIRESVESAVKDEEQRQHDLNKSLERLWKEFDEMGEKVSVDSNHVTGIVNKIKRKMKEIRHLKFKIEELQNAQEEEEPEEDIATYVSTSISVIPSIYSFICQSVCPFICQSVCPFICQSVCPFICQSVCPFICQSVCPFICPSVCPFICQSVCPFICQSVCPFISQSVCPFICQSVCMFICQSICSFICQSICMFICQSVCPTVYLYIPIFTQYHNSN